MKKVLGFLKELSDNNCKEWFDAHRENWAEVRNAVSTFTENLISGLSSYDSDLVGLHASDCLYRINRDIRFSKDKSPYKTWIGIFMCPGGKKSGYAGYYLHIENPAGKGGLLGAPMLFAGLHAAQPFIIKSVREEILDNSDEFIRNIAAAEGFVFDTSDSLKRTPAGFPSGTPVDMYLRSRDVGLTRTLDMKELTCRNFAGNMLDSFKLAVPFVRQINKAVKYGYEMKDDSYIFDGFFN